MNDMQAEYGSGWAFQGRRSEWWVLSGRIRSDRSDALRGNGQTSFQAVKRLAVLQFMILLFLYRPCLPLVKEQTGLL